MSRAEWKPFHVSIHSRIAIMTIGEIVTLEALIKTTQVLDDWDNIAEAWDSRLAKICPPAAILILAGEVRQSLMKQKAAIKKQAEDDRRQNEFEAEND